MKVKVGVAARSRGRQAQGQVLIFFALVIPLLVLLFFFIVGLMAVRDVQAHAKDALSTATRAAARQIEYSGYGQGEVLFDDWTAAETVETVFCDALSLRVDGLADTPENVAQTVEVLVGYGSPDNKWPSPFVKGRVHSYPTVVARAYVPVRVWMFKVTLTVISETEVR